MSTFPVTASEIAPAVRYLSDVTIVDLLTRCLVANRAACLADGWKDVDAAPTAAEILDTAPRSKPTRKVAANAVRALRYNCASGSANHLPVADAVALDAIFLRIMDGVVWNQYRSPSDANGPCGDLVYLLRTADAIRAETAAT